MAKKAKKEKMKKYYQGWYKRLVDSLIITNTNIIKVPKCQKKKKYEGSKKIILEITYYIYNKKVYYSRDYIESKN